MNQNFMEELDLLEREKGVPKETILDAFDDRIKLLALRRGEHRAQGLARGYRERDAPR